MISRRSLLSGLAAALVVPVAVAAPALAQSGRPDRWPDRPDRRPPPPRVERRPSPRRGYVWVSGHWDWTRRGFVWVPGHWERERRGMRWRQGDWVLRNGRWEFRPGGWYR